MSESPILYIAHSRSFDFKSELYEPLKKSDLNTKYALIFPHSESDTPFSSKDLFQKKCDLVVAEVSYPATGLGIELGWADLLHIPIVCIYKSGSKVSGSLKVVSDTFIEYHDGDDMIAQLASAITNKVQP